MHLTDTTYLNSLFHQLLRVLFRLNYFGPLVMGVMDSSFLFLPFGNDLLVTAMVARHHQNFWIYVITAAIGSTCGAVLVDLVARRMGEAGIQKLAGQKRFEKLKRKTNENGGRALFIACIAPPPFPFTMVIATTSALAYPRRKLFLIVALTRALRFFILSLLALEFGRQIIRIMNSAGFRYTMIGFTLLCMAMSVFSIVKWVRTTRSGRREYQPRPAST